MNIFEYASTIIGEYKKGGQKALSENFWNTARKIKEELGEYSYLLDAYLSEIFTALNIVIIDNIVCDAEEMMDKIYSLCKNIVYYEPVKNKDSFYELVHNYISCHPLSYKESETRFIMYIVLLIDDFTDMYLEKIFDKIRLDFFTNDNSDIIKENFQRMCKIIPQEKIENLNIIIKNRFALPTIVDIFKRTVSRNLLYYLLFKDQQTSKQIFQLILEQKILPGERSKPSSTEVNPVEIL